jgi:hypothetical protein
MGRVVREGALRPPQVWIRGDHRQPGPRVAAGPPRVLLPAGAAEDGWGGVVQNRPPEAPARLLFAQWLTRPDHPTFARVMVNRVWQHHFRRPLAGTPSDFGLIGSPPSNARLLDWLACEFAAPESGVRDEAFRLKRLHRMLLTSSAYRQASRSEGTDDAWGERIARDPNFELLSRMERRRLTGEEIRDAMLAAGGGLAFDRGGPGVRPPLPSELVANLLRGQWDVSPRAADHRRRSIYLFVRRNLRYPLFEAFDRPDTNASCPVRPQSTTAPQALTLLNSEPVRDAARELAEAARRDAAAGRTDDAAFVEAAWLRALGRTPEADELARALQFLKSGQAQDDEARVLLCLGLFNVNEFVYVD